MAGTFVANFANVISRWQIEKYLLTRMWNEFGGWNYHPSFKNVSTDSIVSERNIMSAASRIWKCM